MSNIYEFDGFQDLADIVQQYINGAEKAIVGIEDGVKEFVGDLLKLPKQILRTNDRKWNQKYECPTTYLSFMGKTKRKIL